MLDVMQGAVEGDTYSVPPHPGSYVEAASSHPGRLRIAVTSKPPPGAVVRVSADQQGAWERMVRLLSELGHDVIERAPGWQSAGIVFTQTWLRGIYEDSLEVPDRAKLERTTRRMATAGRLVSARRARKLREEVRDRTTANILALWDEVDVLMTPALSSTAIGAEGGYGRGALAAYNLAARFTPWTAPFNITGQPAVAVPAGFADDGLPLSVQLVGRPEAEHVLYSLAGQVEAARPWAQDTPPVADLAPLAPARPG
jgi:amidase